jgi:hypothetical protein
MFEIIGVLPHIDLLGKIRAPAGMEACSRPP